MLQLQSALGLVMLVFLAWGFSENRRRLAWREVAGGIVLQVALAFILLKMPGARLVFAWLNQAVQALSAATEAGTGFVFGYLGGGDPPFQVRPGASTYILAFRGLPLVLVMSALSALLYHWGIIPRVVRALAWMLKRATGISGVEALGTAANIFVGMVEAPVLVRPYLERVSRSELFTIMAAGMATIAGTVMVLYASILEPVIPGVMGHLLVASIISAPAAVTVSKLMVPPVEEGVEGSLALEREARSAMDAVTQGTLAGLSLLLNIIAMLIVFVALVHLANMILGWVPSWGGEPWTVQRLLGLIMAPVTWLMGVPWSEAHTAGSLMGVKTILNEFLAYLQMAALPADALSPRSRLILTYALCGFANMGSLGIMIGGLGAMAPARRPEIVELGVRSIVAGTLATCMTGAVIGLLV
ncbi:concentrative nucleoside transporter, CNT family [Desulfacinum infernum DSM 9756]|uniref:Concentrative nucleoside transporter, CNT family n=1 Tax=Desulfacinum infernum DSM 9756 TaxID=1121391 RepID=A0A1M4WIX1_9BACT|nr:nucleoside transporter C-terminal domain-containing protein [Desulfacinum infernum]SHE81145.1 concentrative nucleoside transporter, CNT family [Desulfacinum infernum DSM 9756]